MDFLTVGQYLRPTPNHAPVREYVTPERFDRIDRLGRDLGFRYVAAGPLVRSSYKAGEFYAAHLVRERRKELANPHGDPQAAGATPNPDAHVAPSASPLPAEGDAARTRNP